VVFLLEKLAMTPQSPPRFAAWLVVLSSQVFAAHLVRSYPKYAWVLLSKEKMTVWGLEMVGLSIPRYLIGALLVGRDGERQMAVDRR
jgi:hypothetical protein